MSDQVKILLPVEGDDDSAEVESVWSTQESSDRFRLDNIPFYARGYALGDVVLAAPDQDGLWRAQKVTEPSGHSTVRLWFAQEQEVQSIRDELRAKGCSSELDLSRLVAVDIPPEVSYASMREYFEQKERAGLFEYEEGCLGQQPLD